MNVDKIITDAQKYIEDHKETWRQELEKEVNSLLEDKINRLREMENQFRCVAECINEIRAPWVHIEKFRHIFTCELSGEEITRSCYQQGFVHVQATIGNNDFALFHTHKPYDEFLPKKDKRYRFVMAIIELDQEKKDEI